MGWQPRCCPREASSGGGILLPSSGLRQIEYIDSSCVLCCERLPALWAVDLGGGGWTAVDCSRCDQVQGIYILPHTATCEWHYQEDDFCQAGATINNLTVDLFAGSLDDCDLRVIVTLITNIFLTCSGTSVAEYRLNPFQDPAAADCGGPYTLSKVSESHSGASPCRNCAGTLPATITAEAA